MCAKTIAIGDDVYRNLARTKKPGESFTDQIRRLMERQGKLTDCIGLWSKWMKAEEMSSIEKSIADRRLQSRRSKEEKEKR